MAVTLNLPPHVENEMRAEAERQGKDLADHLRDLVIELREHRRAEQQARATRLNAMLDEWDAEDAVNAEPGPIPVPERSRMRVPNLA